MHKRLWITATLSVGLCWALAMNRRTVTVAVAPVRTNVEMREPAAVAAHETPRTPRALAAQPGLRPAHLVAVPADFASPGASAANPALERAFDAEPEDAQWAVRVRDDVVQILAEDAQLRVSDVRCAQSFCRVRMIKPIESALDWADVDRLLAPVARGEAIFTATPEGGMSSGYLYFSAHDATLPLDDVHVAGQRPGV